MIGIPFVLLVIALILAVLASIGVSTGRISAGWAALAFLIASMMAR